MSREPRRRIAIEATVATSDEGMLVRLVRALLKRLGRDLDVRVERVALEPPLEPAPAPTDPELP